MNNQMKDVVIVAYGRSAYGKARKGSFAKVHPVEYGAQTLNGVLAKIPQLKHEDIGDVIVGCAMPYGVQSGNMARLITMRAGLPDCVCATTINRYCSSGLQAMATACNAIRCGEEEIVVAGGVESMSMVPMDLGLETGDPWLLANRPEAYMSMGITAENVAERWNVSRADMDAMAAESHRRAVEAWDKGYMEDQIVPVVVPNEAGEMVTVTRDEGMRAGTTAEGLGQLKPCFKPDGAVTAAISSQMTDGAGFVVMMTAEKAAELGLEPIARLKAFSVGGVGADVMGIGPMAAVPKVMAKTGMSVADMDVIELNEAFASQALACIRELGFDMDKVNPMGGAMALGHPLGATGAMLACKVMSYLKRTGGKNGMVTMCIGGGMGAAGIIEMA